MSNKKPSPAGTFRMLKRLGPRIRPQRGRLALAGALILFSTGVGLAFPLVVRELLDAAFLESDPGLLNRIALGLIALFAVQAVVNFGQSYLTAAMSERVVADLRKDTFDGLVRQSPGFFAVRREMPAPTSFTTTGQGSARTARSMASQSPAKQVSPSG